MFNLKFKPNTIVYNGFLSIILAITISGCETEQEKETRASQCYDRIREDHIKKCEAACEINPIDTYCAMTSGDNVIGSGCTSSIKNIANISDNDSSYEKENKLISSCKKSACGSSVIDDAENIKAIVSQCNN